MSRNGPLRLAELKATTCAVQFCFICPLTAGTETVTFQDAVLLKSLCVARWLSSITISKLLVLEKSLTPPEPSQEGPRDPREAPRRLSGAQDKHLSGADVVLAWALFS